MGLSLSKRREKKSYPIPTDPYNALNQMPPAWYGSMPVRPGWYPPVSGYPNNGAIHISYPAFQPMQPIVAPYPVLPPQVPFIPPQPLEKYGEYPASSGFALHRNSEPPVRPFQRGRATPGPSGPVRLPSSSNSGAHRRSDSDSSDSDSSDLNVNPMLRPVPPDNRGAFRPAYSRPRPPLHNPLPSLPRNVYDSSPYRGLLTLKTTEFLSSSHTQPASNPPQPQNHDEKKGVFRKLSHKGLFRTLSSSKRKRAPEPPSIPVVPTTVVQLPTTPANQTMPVPDLPTTPGGPPVVKFDHQGLLSGFMNHSPHRVMYQNETYPSALHLYEALKFIGHRSDLAEKIRKCGRVHDVYPLAATLQEHVRGDWGQVFLKMMDEVLYLKFRQHPDLRSLLMNTGPAHIVYAEAGDSFWGEGPVGQGANELGKAMVRVRDRLRDEGYGL